MQIICVCFDADPPSDVWLHIFDVFLIADLSCMSRYQFLGILPSFNQIADTVFSPLLQCSPCCILIVNKGIYWCGSKGPPILIEDYIL